MLRELSFQIYYAFPIKLKGLCNESPNPNEHFEIIKDTFLYTNDYYFVLNSIIDKKLYKLSRNNLADFLNFFAKHTGISLEMDNNLLWNMTNARNIIAHNNGYNIKPWSIDSAMFSRILEKSQIKQYLDCIFNMCNSLKIGVAKKYKNFTYEKLLLDSWEYSCPKILSIYDVFDFSTGEAKIKINSAINKISQLAVTEKYTVSVWIENYNLDNMYQIMSKVGNVYPPAHISINNELRYLQQLFREYPYLVDGQTFLVENGFIKT